MTCGGSAIKFIYLLIFYLIKLIYFGVTRLGIIVPYSRVFFSLNSKIEFIVLVFQMYFVFFFSSF